MTLLDRRPLGLGAPGMAGIQHAIVLVELLQAEPKLESSTGQDLLQRRDAWLAPAALDTGDLRLGDASTLRQLPLR